MHRVQSHSRRPWATDQLSVGLHRLRHLADRCHHEPSLGDIFAQIFYVTMQFVGVWVWQRQLDRQEKNEYEEVNARMFTWWQGILAVIATIVIYLIVVFVSSHTGGVQVRLDGTLLPLGIVGQILMTYGYRSQWVAWITLDVIKVVIWFNQLSVGGPGAMSMFVLQVVMLANGFYGAWVWFHKSSTMAVSDDLQSSICTESIIANGGR